MIEFMLNKILYKEMAKEMKTVLLAETKDGIKEVCERKILLWVKSRAVLSEANFSPKVFKIILLCSKIIW